MKYYLFLVHFLASIFVLSFDKDSTAFDSVKELEPINIKSNIFFENKDVSYNIERKNKYNLVNKNFNPLFANLNRYSKTDSLGLKYKLEKKLRFLKVINSGGKLPIGKFDFDLTKVIGFNDYEGFRLGVAVSTNEKLSNTYSLNAYSAYGFQDKTVKFGVGAEYYVNKLYSGKFFLQYNQDVSPSGKFPVFLESNYTSFVSNAFSNIYNNNYFSYKTYTFGYQQEIFQNLVFNLSLNYEKQKAEFDYDYKDKRGWFQLYNTQLSVRFAPNENLNKSNGLKINTEKNKPIFYATIAKYWNIFDSDYSPTRINFSYFDSFDTRLGITKFNLNTDWIDGDIPLMNLYEAGGNARHNGFLNFGVAGLNNFETMKAGEFYSDMYISFNIKHIFAGIKVGNNNVILPQFVYRGVLGDMKNKENHGKINFKKLNNYFHETGIEVNNILFNTFGLGVYYRLGAYSEKKIQDNLHVKLTVNLSFS